jgi:hypothetical protein
VASNPLLDALGFAAFAPGDYLRGALAGDVGSRMNPSEFNQELGIPDNMLTELLTGAVVDPWNLVSMGALEAGGRKLSRMAELAGPGYKTAMSDLEGVPSQYVRKFLRGVDLDAPRTGALSYLPPGSEFLGKGSEGIAFKTPRGGVVRLQPETTVGHGERFLGRPQDPSILQPTATAYAPGPMSNEMEIANSMLGREGLSQRPNPDEALRAAGLEEGVSREMFPEAWDAQQAQQQANWEAMLVEGDELWPDTPPSSDRRRAKKAKKKRDLESAKNPFVYGHHLEAMPFADMANSSAVREKYGRDFKQLSEIENALEEGLQDRGILWHDAGPRNWGFVDDKPVVVDPGYMQAMPHSAGYTTNLSPLRQPMGDKLSKLSELLGYRRMVRDRWEALPSSDPTLRNAGIGTTLLAALREAARNGE